MLAAVVHELVLYTFAVSMCFYGHCGVGAVGDGTDANPVVMILIVKKVYSAYDISCGCSEYTSLKYVLNLPT